MRFLMRFVRRNATYKGLLGGSRGWMAVFGVLGASRLLGKYVGREPQTLTVETLQPGQSMTISTFSPPSSSSRRAARRARKRERAGA